MTMNKEKISQKIKNIFCEYKYIVLILLVASLVLFWNNLFHGATFAWYNDQQLQHNIFYQEWYRIVKETIANGRPSFYSWNTFLGTDFFTSKLLYCVGDFLLTPFFVFYNGEINFDFLYTILTIVCILLSGISMNMYLKEFGIQKQIYRNGFALLYALSGFVVTYAGTYMFHRFYALMPLLFLCVERYIKQQKVAGFSFMVAILFLQNYELMFSVSVFLVLYFIFSNKWKKDVSILTILKNAVPLIASYFVGILLCGIAIVPLISFIRSNPRVGALEFGSFFWDFKTFVSFVMNFVCPAYNFRSDVPPYPFYTNEHFSSEFGVFATAMALLGLFHLWKNGNSKEKKTFIITEAVIVLFILVRPLNMVVHGFSEPTLRWSFLLMFFHIALSAFAFDRYEYKGIGKSLFFCVMSLIVLLAAYILVYHMDLSYYWQSILILIVSILMFVIYDYLLRKKMVYALTLGVLNSFIFMLVMISGQKYYQIETRAFNQEYLRYYENEDDEKLYRYYFAANEIQPFNPLNLNASMEYDYRTVTTYDSTYDAMVHTFLSLNGFDSWIIDIQKPELLKMLGVKYIGVLDDTSLKENESVRYAYNLDDLKVYELVDHNSIGHTYSLFATEVDHQYDWNEKLLIKEEDLDKVKDMRPQEKKQLRVLEYNRQYFKGQIDVEDDCVLMVAIPFNEGWTVKDQNENILPTINVQGGFLGVLIDGSVSEISFYYGTPGLKEGIVISVIGFVALIFELWLDNRNKKRLIA